MMPMRRIAGYAVLACLEGFDVLHGHLAKSQNPIFAWVVGW
jgi:hypothetical protein